MLTAPFRPKRCIYDPLQEKIAEKSRYGVNSFSSQLVLKSVRTHFGKVVLSFRSIRTNLVKFSQLVPILVNSYSVW